MNRLRNKVVMAFALVVLGSVSLMLSLVWRSASKDFYSHLLGDVGGSFAPVDSLQRPLLDGLLDRSYNMANDPTLQGERLQKDSDYEDLEQLTRQDASDAKADLVCLVDYQGNVLVQVTNTSTQVGEYKPEILPRLVDGKPGELAPSLKDHPVIKEVMNGTPLRTYALFGSPARLYACAASPLLRGNSVDGVVLVARRVDDAFCSMVAGRLNLHGPLIYAAENGTVIGSWDGKHAASDTQVEQMTEALKPWTAPMVTMDGRIKPEPVPLSVGRLHTLALPYPLWDTLTAKPAGWIYILQPLNELYVLVHNLAGMIVAAGVGGLLVAVLVSVYFSGRITRPIEQLEEKMRKVGEGDLAQQADVVGKDEVARLAQTFNEMTDGLRKKELLKRYVPMSARDLIESNTDGTVVLGGRRIRATVMFSDIRGFTTLSERLDPAEVVKALNEYLEAMIEVIHRHNGDINDYIGDAILAVFHEYDEPHTSALQAVLCAVDMQSALGMLHERSGNPNVQGLRMGIGIHTGVLVEGNMGTADRLKHAVIGDTVNSAARIQDRSRDGKHTCILMSGETYIDVKDSIKAEFFGNEHLKGKAEPVPIWEAVEVLPSATPR